MVRCGRGGRRDALGACAVLGLRLARYVVVVGGVVVGGGGGA
jgi:hypothetical protein